MLLGVAAVIAVAMPGCGAAAAPDAIAIDLSTPPTASSGPAAAPASSEPARATAGEPAPGTYEIYPGIAVPEAWVDCRTEDDCAIVTAGCCDHCNGGAITTVNKAFAEAARAKLEQAVKPPSGCTGCTKLACDAPRSHQLICMTRACHFDDLEEVVRDRIWKAGQEDTAPTGDAVFLGPSK